MNIYYIDPASGDGANAGLDPGHPLASHEGRTFGPGDTVLFKRGSVFRCALNACSGEEGAPVTYGAYGVGARPAFLGSVPADKPEDWTEEAPSVWLCRRSFGSEVCNLVFDGKSCGVLRRSPAQLRLQGDWHCSGEGALRLFSAGSPAVFYRSIECALWGERRIASGKSHIVFRDLSFRNSGVHGYQEFYPRDILITDCDFRFIGGAVWDSALFIRFGNAVELWDGAEDVTVERCVFDTVYDAGVTHQGGGTEHIPRRVFFRDNFFLNCGFAAYESREPASEVYFEDNVCVIDGGGFGLQGEEPVRPSEIWPQPAGHHIFIWRIEPGTQPGPVYIRRNRFSRTPWGMAVYSVIGPEDEEKFVFEGNVYRPAAGTLFFFGGKTWLPSDFARWQNECGRDAGGALGPGDG